MSEQNKNTKLVARQPAVLFVDDLSIVQQAVSSILRSIGCEVKCAYNGLYAINNFRKFDIVFLDIGLPDLSGIEVCARIRADNDGKKIPVIALTAHDDSETVSECQVAEFDGYLVKPLTQEQALLVMQKYLPQFAMGAS
ncbi:MAG: response regulator [Gammaproteobacteria bacterium]|nr:response regulator [Gammaproteobacteria bacterium]